MNSEEKEAVLHCLKSMIDEEVCEECPLYGTTGTDHCEKDCVRLAINALSRSENPNKWIPVSERLPEKSDYYLATVKESSGEKDVRVAWYDGDWKIYGIILNAIAWCELPEPYKASPTGAEGSEE